MEILDLINEQDQVIGSIDKEQSHKDGTLHRLVVGFVFSADGKLLVQKRTDDGLLDHSIGGHVDQGETYSAAITREAQEELNLSISSQPVSIFLSDESRIGKQIRHMIALHEIIVPASWQFSPTEEVHEVIPMTVQQIVSTMTDQPHLFTGGFLDTIKEYIRVKQLPYSTSDLL